MNIFKKLLFYFYQLSEGILQLRLEKILRGLSMTLSALFLFIPLRAYDPLCQIYLSTRRGKREREKSNGKSPLLELLMWSLYAELCLELHFDIRECARLFSKKKEKISNNATLMRVFSVKNFEKLNNNFEIVVKLFFQNNSKLLEKMQFPNLRSPAPDKFSIRRIYGI